MSDTDDAHLQSAQRSERKSGFATQPAPGDAAWARSDPASLVSVQGMIELIFGADRGTLVLRQGFRPATFEVGPKEDIQVRAARDKLGQLRLYDAAGLVHALAAPVVLPDVNLVVEAEGWPNPFGVHVLERPLPWDQLIELCGPVGPPDWWFWVPLPMFAWHVTYVSESPRSEFLEFFDAMYHGFKAAIEASKDKG